MLQILLPDPRLPVPCIKESTLVQILLPVIPLLFVHSIQSVNNYKSQSQKRTKKRRKKLGNRNGTKDDLGTEILRHKCQEICSKWHSNMKTFSEHKITIYYCNTILCIIACILWNGYIPKLQILDTTKCWWEGRHQKLNQNDRYFRIQFENFFY